MMDRIIDDIQNIIPNAKVERVLKTNFYLIKFDSSYDLQKFRSCTPVDIGLFSNKDSRTFGLNHLKEVGGDPGYHIDIIDYTEHFIRIQVHDSNLLKGLE